MKFLEKSVCIDIKLVNEMTNKCLKDSSVASYFISFKSKEKKVLFFIFILSFFDLKKFAQKKYGVR